MGLDNEDDDDDGDGIPDDEEDYDGDGLSNEDDEDDDGDGVLDGDEDDDGDGLENDEDNDDDGDAILDENDELYVGIISEKIVFKLFVLRAHYAQFKQFCVFDLLCVSVMSPILDYLWWKKVFKSL